MASAENEFVYSKINFGEPQPAVNRPEVIIGVVSVFLVRMPISASRPPRIAILTRLNSRFSHGCVAFSAYTSGYG